MSPKFFRNTGRVAVLAFAVGLAAAAGTAVAQVTPAPDRSDTKVGPACALYPGFRDYRSPVPIRATPGFTAVRGWGRSCDRIAVHETANGAGVRCQDGNVSVAWYRINDFTARVEGWVSACDIQ